MMVIPGVTLPLMTKQLISTDILLDFLIITQIILFIASLSLD
jgi:hypothetical protein